MRDNKKTASIFIVDDDEGTCKLLSLLLKEELKCDIKCFYDAYSCYQTLSNPEEECSLLITDFIMPGMDGIELLKMVKFIRPWLSTIMVSGYGNIPLAIKAIKTGSIDFMEKPVNEKVLVTQIKDILARKMNFDPATGKPLTNCQTQILKLIADGKTNSEIALMLHRSSRTIERHKYLLMRKLNADSQAKLIKTAISLGLSSLEYD